MTASPRALLRAIARWPTESQLQARRNALVASTALTQAMTDRRDAEEFLEGLPSRTPPADRAGATAADAPAARCSLGGEDATEGRSREVI